MMPWRVRSLVKRLAALFALIMGIVVTAVGVELYDAASMALARRADYSSLGRVEHFRTLLQDLYTIKQLEERATLFETMLGNEQDVMIFRVPGERPFINVNPDKMVVPEMAPVPVGQPIGLSSLVEGSRADGVRVRWVSALAKVGDEGQVVEIVGAHVMTQEAAIMNAYLKRVAITISLAIVIAALLGYWVLRRGLQPLHQMAAKAAQITPSNMTTRLDVSTAPDELRSLAASFNAMLDRLAKGYEHLSQFAADLAHEIRTPIGAMIGQTQVTLARVREPIEYQGVLESNLEELDRMSRMAQNILFLAHADHAGLVIDRVSLDIHRELSMIGSYFEGLAEERQLRFDIEASGSLHADDVMCRRAIGNLVVNAVRYATAGTTIRMHGAEDGRGGAVITISNRGERIAPDVLHRLFDRFYRGDEARSRLTESSGLGLSIVKAIMVLHGGRAEVSCDAQGWIHFRLLFDKA